MQDSHSRLVISSGRDKLMEVHDKYGHYQMYAAHGWKFMTHVVCPNMVVVCCSGWNWCATVGGTASLLLLFFSAKVSFCLYSCCFQYFSVSKLQMDPLTVYKVLYACMNLVAK